MMLSWTRYIVAPRSCMLAPLSSLSIPPPCHRPWVFNSWHFHWANVDALFGGWAFQFLSPGRYVCVEPKASFFVYQYPKDLHQKKLFLICIMSNQALTKSVHLWENWPAWSSARATRRPAILWASTRNKSLMYQSPHTYLLPSRTNKHINFSSSTICFNRDPEYHGNFTFTFKIYKMHCSYFPLFL
jgi:hypothetical protein